MTRTSHFEEDYVMGEDGYYVFWPLKPGGGAFSAWHLREIADELDRRNAAWDEQVRRDLSVPDTDG
jgi:hypothetical protein